MSRAIVTLCIVLSLGLVAGCGSLPARDAAAERVVDPAQVERYNLEMARRAKIEAEARRRGIILIWAHAVPKPVGQVSNDS